MARVPGKQIKYSRELKLRKKLTIKKRALVFSGFANLANLWFGSSVLAYASCALCDFSPM